MPRWLPGVQAGVVIVLLATVIAAPLYALIIFWTGGSASSQENRLHLNTKNSTRYTAERPEAIVDGAQSALFPSGEAGITVPFDDWQTLAAAAPLASLQNTPLRSGPEATVSDEIEAQVQALEAYAESPVIEALPRHVLVVSDTEPALAAPFVAWSSFSGAPLLLAGEQGISAEVMEALQAFAPALIIAGPEVSEDALANVRDIAPVVRVGSQDPVENGLEFAGFGQGLIGWDYGKENPDPMFHNFWLVNQNQPELAVWAGAYAGRGKMGPLLLTNRDLPESIEAFSWELKPDWVVTPAEGPFNHFVFMGTPDDISWEQQSELDWSTEIKRYVTQGSGLSPMDALVIGWIVLALGCAAWIALNVTFRMPSMMPLMRMMWALLGVLLGPFAVLIYLYSYHRRPMFQGQHAMTHRRNSFGEVLVATSMGIAFGASIMIATAFFMQLFGLPLFVFDGPLFWMGSPMPLMMFGMWLAAVVVALPLFQFPMIRMRGVPLRRAWWFASASVVISMTAASLGMMSTTWWLQMNSPLDTGAESLFGMMQSEESLLFAGALLMGSIIGFVTALPFNALLVRQGWRPGVG